MVNISSNQTQLLRLNQASSAEYCRQTQFISNSFLLERLQPNWFLGNQTWSFVDPIHHIWRNFKLLKTTPRSTRNCRPRCSSQQRSSVNLIARLSNEIQCKLLQCKILHMFTFCNHNIILTKIIWSEQKCCRYMVVMFKIFLLSEEPSRVKRYYIIFKNKIMQIYIT